VITKYKSYLDRIDVKGPKRLLALDGGGIRGLITVEILLRLEELLRRAYDDEALVLADFFDYVGGTSTGAIIATCIARGMTMERVRQFYIEGGRIMLKPAPILRRWHYRHLDSGLSAALKRELGEQTTFGDPGLQTLLLLVMRNATTDSPWPLSNNPKALFNAVSEKEGNNLLLPLWQLIRASTAAPTYFPPQMVSVGERNFVFVDGAVSVYNNPSFLLYMMATLPAYRLCWEQGEEQLLLVSVGTGMSAYAASSLRPAQMTLLYNAERVPSALIYAANVEADKLCRVSGACRFGGPIDSELGDLIDRSGSDGKKKFTYLRYDPSLTREGLDALGLTDIQPEEVLPLTSDLSQLGAFDPSLVTT
jgi:patatin-like phospholipase/acyl hydrolase